MRKGGRMQCGSFDPLSFLSIPHSVSAGPVCSRFWFGLPGIVAHGRFDTCRGFLGALFSCKF
jgi:hypothetical protein